MLTQRIRAEIGTVVIMALFTGNNLLFSLCKVPGPDLTRGLHLGFVLSLKNSLVFRKVLLDRVGMVAALGIDAAG
jgi:hypothetical protein